MKSRLKLIALTAVLSLAIAALALPATPASAAEPEPCGTELVGSGSSLQAAAQTEVWSSGWKGSECKAKPTVKYTTTSNALALEQWGANKGVLGGATGIEKPFPIFIATDLAPEGPVSTEGTQMSNVVKAGGVLKYAFSNEAVTVPVAQEVVAVIVSLPKGCKVEGSTPQVKSKVLGEEWEKGTVAFKTLLTGVKLEGKACEEVKKESGSLQPLLEAREGASGATAGLKRYLVQVAPGGEFKGLTTTAEKSANAEWPKTLPAGSPEKKGNTSDKALAQGVVKTAGSIGYADLADALAVGLSATPTEVTKGSGYKSFFVQVQNNARESSKPEFIGPENEKGPNCGQVKYKGVPAEVEPNADWSQAIDSSVEAGKIENYPICMLTYDVLWLWSGAPEVAGTNLYSEEGETAAYDYIRYVVETESEGGGQTKTLEGKHYGKLTEEIQKSAATGLGIRNEEPVGSAVEWPKVEEEASEAPGKGRPWVVTLGDSFTAGEGGRWAGNSNTLETFVDALGRSAYFDNATHTAEKVLGCHRSASAEAYITLDPRPFEVAGVNLACSGAKTGSFLYSLEFVPGLDETNNANGKGQVLLLKEYAERHNVNLIVVSIGGNNFGFTSMVGGCVRAYMEVTAAQAGAKPCSRNGATVQQFYPLNVAAKATEVKEAIARVSSAMTAAGYNEHMYTILLQNYPSLLASNGAEFRYPEADFPTFARQSTGGCGFLNADATWANNTAIPALNSAVRRGVTEAGLGNVKFLNVSKILKGRRLCETGLTLLEDNAWWVLPGAVNESEWVNQIKTDPSLFGEPGSNNQLFADRFRTSTRRFFNYTMQEAFHPNYWAQLALRNCLRQSFFWGFITLHSGRCLRSANGLTEDGEPMISFEPAWPVISHSTGVATGKGQTFVVGETTVKCSEAKFQWKLVGSSYSWELKPEYANCKAVSGKSEVAAKVVTKGCVYGLGEFAGAEEFEGQLSLSKGCVIELSAFTPECHVKVEGPQELEDAVFKDLSTSESSPEGEVSLEAHAVDFISEGEGCEAVGVPKEGTGEYDGELTEKGVLVEEPGIGLWHKRPIGEGGDGIAAGAVSLEKVNSKGGESKLTSKVVGESVAVTCTESKGEGVLYDGSLGGQVKLLLALGKCSTKFPHCVVAEPISIPANLHLMWKWNGLKASLEQGKQQIFGQKPTVLLTHNEIEAGAPKGEDELTTVKFKKESGGSCILEGISLPLKGYEAAELEPQSIEQFSKEPKLKFTPGKHLEHYWGGSEETGLETTLKLGSERAELTSSVTITPIAAQGGEEQEVGLFED